MGKKNRQRRNGGGAVDDTASKPAARRAFLTVTVKSSVTEVLWHALASLDGVAEESHRHHQKQQPQQDDAEGILTAADASRKRHREDAAAGPVSLTAVYAAMARPHYDTIDTAVAAYGLQLLPVVHEITRRVGLALGTPSLASPESWESAAMLCAYYGAGPAARMAEELLELLVRARGVFFFDAPCVIGDGVEGLPKQDLSELRAGGRAAAKDAAASADWGCAVSGPVVMRKLVALRDMLAAVGPFVPASLLQRVALRFTFEVVEGGILSLDSQPVSKRDGRLCWRIPVSCHAACLSALQTLLMLRAAPAEVAVCAARVAREVTASLHQGCPVRPASSTTTSSREQRGAEDAAALYAQWPAFSVYKDVVAAAVQLRQTLSLLRHPQTLPLYTPPTFAEERVVAKVLVMANEPAAAPQAPPVPPPLPSPMPPTAAEGPAVPAAVPVSAVSEHPALAAPPPRVSPPPPSAAASRVEEGVPTAPPVRATVTKGSASGAQQGGTALFMAASGNDGESIPDIDMDDD